MSISLHSFLDMSYKDGSDDAVRRLADELGRHRLTDVQEENEDDFSAYPVNTTRRNRYSSIGSTASSMDYLWDLHPRRLSEAGLSRHSDNSTVLTEDTDNFIIGQKVWVGGSKPGTIAYIGDTQFAPGEWAGIVLDQPIGKNDGSVGGTRYFQCEPKKGVFSRLTRLTRYPLTDPEMGSGDTYVCSTPINNGTRRSPISPTGSTSLLKYPPSLTTSNTSLASTYVDYKLGDRVIIKSSQGSKIGTLRYIGTTDFASGEWCGVELDDPRGKNDGSVEGKRYFECRQNFGLFAPVAKVSRSPSSRRPGSCVVHSGAGIPPSGFKRANSKESLASNASITSAASGVRREVLKEKQQHIEQLLKERDLERAEIARATEDADQKLATLRQEYEQYRSECQRQLKEHKELLTQLKVDREEILANLEDEKRKNEDLQFRFEEAAITKADIEQKLRAQYVTNEANLERIKDLEATLASERDKIVPLEADSNKLFEAEEAMVRLREENEILRYEIEVATAKIVSVESEWIATKDSVISLQGEVNELRVATRQKDETIEKFKSDSQKLTEDYDVAKTNLAKELDEFKSKNQVSSAECLEQKTVIEILRSDLSETKGVLGERTKALEKLSASTAEVQEKLSKEINKLKMDLSAKNLDLENNGDIIRSKEEEIRTLKSQFEMLNDNLQTQTGNIDTYKENMKATETSLRKELEESRAAIKAKITEVEEAKKEFILILAEKETKLQEANKTVQQYQNDIEKLNENVLEAEKTATASNQEIEEKFSQKLQDAENRLASATTDLSSKNEELTKALDLIRQLEADVLVKTDGIAKIEADLDAAKKRIESESTSATKSNEEITQLKLSLGDLQRKLETSNEKVSELSQQKSKLENEVHSLIGSSGDYSSKLEELTKDLKDKETVIETIKNEFTGKLQAAEHCKHELELKCITTLEKSEREKQDYEEKIGALIQDNDVLKQQCEVVSKQNASTVEDLNKKIKELQDSIEEKQRFLQTMQEEAKSNEEKIKGELAKTSGDLGSKLVEMQKKIDDLVNENNDIKDNLGKKSVELIEAESKHNQFVEQSKQIESEFKAAHEEQLKKLEYERKESENQMNKIIETTKKQLTDQLENSTSASQELDIKYNKFVQESQIEKTDLQEQIKSLIVDKDKLVKDNSKALEDLNAKLKEVHEKDEAIKKVEDNFKEQLEKTSADLLENQKKIEDLVKENDTLNLALSQKSTELIESTVKYKDIVVAETNLKASYEDQVTKLRSEIAEKENQLQKFTNDFEEMKNSISSTESSINEKEEQYKQLKQELQINHQFAEKILAENKELVKKQEEQVDANEKLKKLTEDSEQISKSACELELSNNLYVTLLQLVQLTEKQKIMLVDQVQIIGETNTDDSFKKLCKLVDNIKVKVIDEEQQRISELETEVQVLQKLVQETDMKLKSQESENLKLRKTVEANKVKTATSKIPTKLDNPITIPALNNNPVTNDQLVEEKLFAESQVAFLNSIIVDMQKKNEEQKMRIEILESGYSPAAADELKLIGLTDRKLPPRMYCDICEEFDLHETEDCPQQANGDAPARDKGPKEKPEPRSYCEICEVFGHSTEDCHDDQTF